LASSIGKGHAKSKLLQGNAFWYWYDNPAAGIFDTLRSLITSRFLQAICHGREYVLPNLLTALQFGVSNGIENKISANNNLQASISGSYNGNDLVCQIGKRA